jgi:hypothetical protein
LFSIKARLVWPIKTIMGLFSNRRLAQREPQRRLNRVYPAGVVLGAVVTHLASEFFGMGADADAHIVLSPRHIYLAVAALVCLAIIVFEARRLVRSASGVRDLKRLLSNETSALPLGGGWLFCILAAAVQFAAGVGSAIGEGCFFCGHDVLAGVIGALVTAIMLALMLRAAVARLPRLAASIAGMLLPAVCQAPPALRPRFAFAWSPRLVFWSPQIANRPPPLLF